MTLLQLDHEQKLALVALLELFTMADGVVSEGEAAQINKIAEGIGDEAYRDLLNVAEERFADVEMLKASLLTIKERGARELIYGLLMEEVMNSPAVSPSPALLDWLKEAWEVDVSEA
jgi:hypothetical protein